MMAMLRGLARLVRFACRRVLWTGTRLTVLAEAGAALADWIEGRASPPA